jgi:glutamate-5-semialdehyde dehydrogenase
VSLIDWTQWKSASRFVRDLPEVDRRWLLESWANELNSESRAAVLSANEKDIKAAQLQNHPAAFLERLEVNEKRLASMATTLRAICESPSPVGRVESTRILKNGLELRRVREPVGTVLVIFESRPNIITEVLGVGVWSGNAMLLKGGKEAYHTTKALSDLLHKIWTQKWPETSAPFQILSQLEQQPLLELLKEDRQIQLLIPRGGEGLISFCERNSRIPMLRNSRGLCHAYIHESADVSKAVRVVVNAKTSRPSVCNAVESLLVDRKIAEAILPVLDLEMARHKVRWNACPQTLRLLKPSPLVRAADEGAFDREHLDLELNCKVVDGLDEAIAHISRHGSHHSELIMAESAEAARRFQAEVNSAAVFWNASTRFTDGFEFGLGGEIGISTELVFERGPLGPSALTSLRWLINGQGQVRE